MPYPKKPTKIHMLNGNPSKIKDLGKNEPKPIPKAPKCPSWLDKEAKKEWRRIAPQLEKLGLLTQIDMAALVIYCESWSLYKRAMIFIHENGESRVKYERDEDGQIMKDEEGQPLIKSITVYPEVLRAEKATETIRRFCQEFGFTPAARSRIQVPGADEPDDDIEKLLSKG